MKDALIGLLIIFVLLCFGAVAVYFLEPSWFASSFGKLPGVSTVTEQRVPPEAPSALSTSSVSYEEVSLYWQDNANNEDGFRVYRNGSPVATLGSNVTTYRDQGLSYATYYSYTVSAYNELGQSPHTAPATVKTLNPPITITLDKVGVYDDGESWLRGKEGEQYLYVVVIDGKTKQELRVPAQGHFHLDDNEVVPVGLKIFHTSEVGDYLRFFVVAYEDDGGGFEPLVYEAIALASIEALTGGTGIGGLFAGVLGGLIGSFFGAEDDYLGTFERIWYADSSWGAGQYSDIARDDLRLWFTIAVP